MTDEALDGLKEEMYAPLSDEDRDIKNIYQIITENEMDDMLNEDKFGSLFGMYERVIVKEKEYTKKMFEK